MKTTPLSEESFHIKYKDIPHDHCTCSFFQFCHNTSQIELALAISKLSFESVPLADFLKFLAQLIRIILAGTAEPGTGNPNAMLLAERPVGTAPVQFVSKDSLGIPPEPSAVVFHRPYEFTRLTLVVGVEAYAVHEGVPVYHADGNLCAKLRRRLRLSPDYWSDPWLGKADNPVRDRMGPVVEHLLLLRMECAYGGEPLLLNVLKIRETLSFFVFADIAEVPVDASELVSYLLADFKSLLSPCVDTATIRQMRRSRG